MDNKHLLYNNKVLLDKIVEIETAPTALQSQVGTNA